VLAHVRHKISEIDQATVQHQVTERDGVLESRSQSQPVERRAQLIGDANSGRLAHVVFR
jgi:hypothetical protein